jgi:RNA polymerase sigma-70 factor (ECF subfamily)
VDQPKRITEKVILELKQEQNLEENFRLLFEEYYPNLYSFFRWLGKSREEAEDLISQVFLRVFKGLGKLRADNEDQLKGWLFAMARTVCINDFNRMRRKKRGAGAQHVPLESAYDVQDPATDCFERIPERSELEKEVWDVLGQMPPQRRNVAILHYMFDFSIPEIADMLGIADGSVKKHLFMAREDFRKKLGKETNG